MLYHLVIKNLPGCFDSSPKNAGYKKMILRKNLSFVAPWLPVEVEVNSSGTRFGFGENPGGQFFFFDPNSCNLNVRGHRTPLPVPPFFWK